MKRRDLIKAGVLAAGVAALSGCAKDNKDVMTGPLTDITPKQTDTYKFATILPFDFKAIDELANLNTKYKKSQVKTLLGYAPVPSYKFNDWLQSTENPSPEIKTFEDFKKYVNYAQEKGFKIGYLMTSPKPFSEKDFNSFKGDFLKLLDDIKAAGIDEIRIANTQVATQIDEYRSGLFKLHISNSFEYHNTSQYMNLIHNYPSIRSMDVTVDENHNFHLIRSLRKIFANRPVELMVNDPCMKGCPARISHASTSEFNKYDCITIKNKDRINYMLKLGTIYPWYLEYYSALGVNNFRILPYASHTPNLNLDALNLKPISNYLECIENGIDNYPVNDFISEILGETFKLGEKVKLSKLASYLPDVKQFIKTGNKCVVRCGTQCTYCDKMAENLTSYLKNQKVSL